MVEVRELLETHSGWQHSRRALSWAEKVRIAQRLMESFRQLRRVRSTNCAPEQSAPPTR